MTWSGPCCTPRRARNNVFMAPSADCAEAETLPLRREWLRPHDGEGRIAYRSHRDGMANLLFGQAERRSGQLPRCARKASCDVWSKPLLMKFA